MSTPTKKLSIRMLEALTRVAASQKLGTRSFLPDFRLNTVVGLMSRSFIDTTDTGYVLTLSGEAYLIDNSHMLMDGTTVIYVTTGKISVSRRLEMTRAYHIKKALGLYNADYLMLTGKNGVGTVDDLHNNVGRRCNIRNNDDFENRCHEILAEVVFYSSPSIEREYLTVYIGTEETDSDPYNIVAQDRLTNLY